MKRVLVTGSSGFIGKNLIVGLRRCENVEIITFDIEDDLTSLAEHLRDSDIVFHLAGVNRPERDEEFELGNAGLTGTIVDILEKAERNVPIVLSSSIQATLYNPYGISKKKAEDVLIEYGNKYGAKVYIYIVFPMCLGNGVDRITIQ